MGQSPKGDDCNSSGIGIPLLNGPTEFQLIHPSPVQWSTNTKKLSKSGDLLFCVRGSTTGRMNWSDQEYGIGRGLAAISPIHDDTIHFFRGVIQLYLPTLLAGATGSTFPNVSRGDLESIPVSINNLSYIKNASAILKALESKSELIQKMNQTLEGIAKTIFKSWFVDFDPVRAKLDGRPTGLSPQIRDLFPDEFVNSEIGEIPKGWKLSSLSEVFDIQGGSQPPAKLFIDKHKEGYVRLLQIRDYDNSNHKTYIPKNKNLRLVDEDDVLIGRYGSGNGKFMEDSLGRPLRGLSGAINVAVVKTIPKLENSREFIANLVSTGMFYKWIVGGSARAVQAGFKKDDLDYVKLSVPPPKILSIFEEFGSLVWERVKSFREENRVLTELRVSLLPKLISGKLQIPDAEKFLKEVGI